MRRVLLSVGLGLLVSFLVMARVLWHSAQEARKSRPVSLVEVAAMDPTEFERLQSRLLGLPVEGMQAASLRDTFSEARDGHLHEALDILAPRGTRVLAVDDGRVVRLFSSARGGLTVYQFDPTGTFCYYYAHLDAYAPGLDEGDELCKGSPVGYVGTTGNAPRGTPHLHLAVFKLGPERRWWEGRAMNPYPLWARPRAPSPAATR